jgi:hypothetical protein
MSDSEADNKSVTSVKSGSFPRNKELSQAQPTATSRVQIGIEELRGYYYVYGRPDQTQVFRKTSEYQALESCMFQSLTGVPRSIG